MLSSNTKYFGKVDSKQNDRRKKFLAQLLCMTSLREKFTLHSMSANLFWQFFLKGDGFKIADPQSFTINENYFGMITLFLQTTHFILGILFKHI